MFSLICINENIDFLQYFYFIFQHKLISFKAKASLCKAGLSLEREKKKSRKKKKVKQSKTKNISVRYFGNFQTFFQINVF